MGIGQAISDFFTSLVDWLKYALDFLVGLVSGVMDAVVYYVKLALYAVSNPLFDALQSLLDGSGLSAKVAYLQNAFSGPLGYFADYFLLPQSLAVMGSAFLIRFIIRRLPMVG